MLPIPLLAWVPTLPANCWIHPYTPWDPWWLPTPPTLPRRPPNAPIMLPIPLLALSTYTPLPAPHYTYTPNTPVTAPNSPYTPKNPSAPLCHLYPFWLSIVITLQLTIFTQLKCSFSIIVIFNCCHFATDHLHEYVQSTRYHLKLSRIPLQCCEAQPISAVSPKICTIKSQ